MSRSWEPVVEVKLILSNSTDDWHTIQIFGTGVRSQDDSVSDSANKEVLQGMTGKVGNEVEHAIRDHFLMLRYFFVLFNSSSHILM